MPELEYRLCLKCRKSFRSRGRTNRICRKCAERNDQIEKMTGRMRLCHNMAHPIGLEMKASDYDF